MRSPKRPQTARPAARPTQARRPTRPQTARPTTTDGLPPWLERRKRRPLDAGYRLPPKTRSEYGRAIAEAALREQQHVRTWNPVSPRQLELVPIDLRAAEGARDAEYYSQQAFQHRVHGKLRAAIRAYTRAARLNPGDLKALLNRGVLLFRAGRFEAALKSFRQASDGDNPALLFNAAACHIQLERYAEAEALLTRAIGNSARPDERFYRARALTFRKRALFSRAVNDYVKAEELRQEAQDQEQVIETGKDSGIRNAFFSQQPLFRPEVFQLARQPPEGPAPYVLARICAEVLAKPPADRSPAEVQMLLDLTGRFAEWQMEDEALRAALNRALQCVELPQGAVLYEAGGAPRGQFVLVSGRLTAHPSRLGVEVQVPSWEDSGAAAVVPQASIDDLGPAQRAIEGETPVGSARATRTETLVAAEPCVLAYMSWATRESVQREHGAARLAALVDFLREVPLLSLLSDREIKGVAERAATVKFAREGVLAAQGEVPEGLFVIRQGRVRVVSEDVILQVIGQRQAFGEQAILRVNRLEAAATASYVAMEPTEVVLITKAALFEATSYLARQAMRAHSSTAPKVNVARIVRAKAQWSSYRKQLLDEVVQQHSVNRKLKHAARQTGARVVVIDRG